MDEYIIYQIDMYMYAINMYVYVDSFIQTLLTKPALIQTHKHSVIGHLCERMNLVKLHKDPFLLHAPKMMDINVLLDQLC